MDTDECEDDSGDDNEVVRDLGEFAVIEEEPVDEPHGDFDEQEGDPEDSPLEA